MFTVVPSRSLFAWLLLFCLFALCLPLKPCVADLTAEQVTRGKQATALVLIKKEQRSGTAFCIDAGGFFVTNAHVVADLQHGEIIRLVLNPGEATQTTVQASVVQSDKTADLALLRVDASKPFPFLPLGTDAGVIETTRVTAYGYPFGTELAEKQTEYPSVTVSTGHVTALRKTGGALQHIQIDASLNPGNSGGPVVDEQNQVIGVVQAGIVGTGVNVAIPVSHLSRFLNRPRLTFEALPATASLTQPHDLTARVVTFHRLLAGVTVRVIFNPDTPKARTVPLEPSGTDTYRARVPLVPAPAGNRMLQIQAQAQGGSVSGQIADQVVRMGGKSVWLSEIDHIENGNGGRVTLKDGTEFKGNPIGMEAVTVHIGSVSQTLNLGKFDSVTLTNRAAQEVNVAYRVEARQGGEVIAALTGRIGTAGNVSETDGRMVTNGAETTGADAKRSGEDGRVTPTHTHKSLVTPRAVIMPPHLMGDKVIVTLPSEAEEVAYGGGGRYLILHLPKLRKLAVFDVNEGRIARYLSVPSDDIVFAAGNDKLMIVLNDQNLIQRWSLKTGEREMNVPLSDIGLVRSMALGAGTDGPLLIIPRDKAPMWYDIGGMSRFDTDYKLHREGYGAPNYGAYVRAAVDGSAFTGFGVDGSPSGVSYIVLRGNMVEGRYVHDSYGYVAANWDGSLVCTCRGIFNSELKLINPERFKNVLCVPALHPAYFLGIPAQNFNEHKKVSVSIYATGDKRLLLTLPPFEEIDTPDQWGREKLTLDKRVMFVPAANLLVTLADGHNQLVLRRFDLMTALNAANMDYLFVSSMPERVANRGSRYTYQIETRSRKGNVTYALDSAPPGMTLSKMGRLEWQVPTDSNSQENVIVSIRDGSGQEAFHTFHIVVE